MAGKSRSKKNLEVAVQSALRTKQDKPNLVPALVGAYVNGQKTMAVANRNDFIWCRMRGDTSEVIQAFNDAVGEHFDLPILVYRDPDFPTVWKVYGRDIRAYEDWGNVSYLPPHGDAHSFSGLEDSGIDTVWVAKRQYMPLLPRPVVTGTSAIYLEPDFYYFDGQYHWWPGSGTTSLLTHMPTGGATARFVTVYINSAGNPDYINGPEYVLIPSPPDIGNYITLPTPAQGVPICAVRLYTGTTSISWGDIFDLRNPNQPLQNTGSSISFFDESVYKGVGYGLNVVGSNIEVSISGSYAHLKSTASGSFTVYDENVLKGQVYGLNVVGSGLQIVVSGTVAHLMQTGSAVTVPVTGSVGVYDESILLGQATAFNFVGSGVEAVMSGTVAHVMHTGSGGGGGGHATGTMVIYDENTWLGVFDEMRFIGDHIAAYNSGSYVAIVATGTAASYLSTGPGHPICTVFNNATQSISNNTWTDVLFQGEITDVYGWHDTSTGTPHITPTEDGEYVAILQNLRFDVTYTGTVIEARIIDQAGNAWSRTTLQAISGQEMFMPLVAERSHTGGQFIRAQVYQNSGGAVDLKAFGKLTVYKLEHELYTPIGNGIRSTYALVGEPVPLDTITGAYWKVPTDIYATGSLNLFLDGLSQLAGTAFTEQHPESGTFQWQFSLPTGVILEAKWGAPVDQVQIETGTFVIYDDGALISAGISSISFEETLDVATTGSYAYVKRSQVGARASRSTDQTIGNASDTAVIFDTEVHDYGDCWISSTGTRLTAPVKGVYSVGGNVQFAAGGASTSRQAYIRANGDSNERICWEISEASDQVVRISISSNYELDAGEYIELMVYQNSGGDLDINANNVAFPHAWLTLLFET